MVFVSLDFPKFATTLQAFVQRFELTAEVLWLVDPDANTWIPKVDPDWEGVIPATLVVNQSRNIRAFKESSFTQEELTAWIDSLIQ